VLLLPVGGLRCVQMAKPLPIGEERAEKRRDQYGKRDASSKDSDGHRSS
jgi:hypothetical protein